MSVWKSPILYFGILLVLVVGAALIAPFVVDWNRYSADLEDYGSKLTGRKVSIEGPISVRLFPWPELDAAQVTVANAKGFDGPSLMRASRANFHLSLAALFSGQVKVESVDLFEPQLNIQINAAGEGNWHLSPTGNVPALLSNVLLEEINVHQGSIGFKDLRHGLSRFLTQSEGRISAAAANGPWRAQLRGTSEGVPLTINVSSLAAKPDQPLPIVVQLVPEDGTFPALSFDGSVDGGKIKGRLLAQPVITEDGRTGLSGSFKPLNYQAQVETEGDRISFTKVRIVAADPKDTGTLVEGEASVDMSKGWKIDTRFNAPHVDLDRLAQSGVIHVSQAGGLTGTLNGLIASFPQTLDFNMVMDAAAVTAGGETFENFQMTANAAAGAIRVQDLTSDLPGHSRMKYSGVIFPGDKAADLGGKLALETNDARAFAQWLWPEGKDQIAEIWKGTRGRLKTQSDVVLGGKRFALQNLDYEFDGLPGKVDVTVTLGAIPALDLNLRADQFDLSSYVTGSMGGEELGKGILALLPSQEGFQKKLQVKFGRLNANGVEARDVAVDFTSSASGFEMKDFSIGSVEGASVKGNGLVLVGDQGPSGDVKFAVAAPRPQGLLRLLGIVAQGNDPPWVQKLGQTDLRADMNMKPGAKEPLVSYSISGSSGGFQIVSSGTLQNLQAAGGTELGFSGTVTSKDAHDVFRLFGLDVAGTGGGEGQASVTIAGDQHKGYKLAIDAAGLGAQLGYSGTYAALENGYGLSGSFLFSAEHAAEFLAAIGFPLPVGVTDGVSANVDVTPLPEGLNIKSIRAKFGAQEIAAVGQFTAKHNLTLEAKGGNFQLKNLIAASLAPWNGPGSWPNGSFQKDWPYGVTGDITYRPATLEGLTGEALLQSELKFASGEGGKQFHLKAQTAAGNSAMLHAVLKAKGAGFVLEGSGNYPLPLDIVTARDGKAPAVMGLALAEGTIIAEGRSLQSMMNVAVGQGKLAVKSARLNGLAPDPFYAAVASANNLDLVQKAFAELGKGEGLAIQDGDITIEIKDGIVAATSLNADSSAAKIDVTPAADLPNGTFGVAAEMRSKATPNLPPLKLLYSGAVGHFTDRVDAKALSNQLGAALINKDMEAMDKLQQEQKKAAEDAVRQADADKAKFDAFQQQRSELRLQQRMIAVFQHQRTFDAANAKARMDEAISAGQAITKEEKRILQNRIAPK